MNIPERKGPVVESRVGGMVRGGLVAVAFLLATAGCSQGEGRSTAGQAPEGESSSARVASPDSALDAQARELLPEVEAASGMANLGRVRLALRSRAELESYLEGQLEEALPAERAGRIADTYRRLDLLPDTLDLRSFLRKLYMEQVAGYYDPASDTLFVMRGASGERLQTVLVHEMVHALQDQRADLDSISRALEGTNDRSTAFQSAVEGQATYVMTEWRLSRIAGRQVDLTEMPGVMERLRDAAGTGGGVMPVFESAPAIIRETLTFPYLDGMAFVQALWGERPGRPPPLDSLLPLSTEQVMHPVKLAGRGADPPTSVAPARLPDGWDQRYADGLGELELGIYLWEHGLDRERARRLASGWDGDLAVLARGPDGREALVWTGVWDSAAGADSVAAGLREAARNRDPAADGRSVRVYRRELGGRPAVLMLDLEESGAFERWLGLASAVELEELVR